MCGFESRSGHSVFEFFAGTISGAALLGVVLIIIGPSRRIRSEPAIDDEVEVRILLGLDPEPSDQEDETDSSQDSVRYSANQIKELEDLSRSPKKRKRT